MVPISPTSVAMLASDQSQEIRVWTSGVFSRIASSTALATSSSPRLARVNPARTTFASGALGAAPQSFTARSTLPVSTSLVTCSMKGGAFKLYRNIKVTIRSMITATAQASQMMLTYMKGPPSWKKLLTASKTPPPETCEADTITEYTVLLSIGLINVCVLSSPVGLAPWQSLQTEIGRS